MCISYFATHEGPSLDFLYVQLIMRSVACFDPAATLFLVIVVLPWFYEGNKLDADTSVRISGVNITFPPRTSLHHTAMTLFFRLAD